jgi:hypothetical protein
LTHSNSFVHDLARRPYDVSHTRKRTHFG